MTVGEATVRTMVKEAVREAMDSCPARLLCRQYGIVAGPGFERMARDERPPLGALVLYPTGHYDEWDIGEYMGPDEIRPIFHKVRTFTPGRLEMTVGEIRPVTDKFKVW